MGRGEEFLKLMFYGIKWIDLILYVIYVCIYINMNVFILVDYFYVFDIDIEFFIDIYMEKIKISFLVNYVDIGFFL